MADLLERLRTVDSPDGGVVLDVKNGNMFRLNSVGMRILSLLKAGAPASGIVDEISREYGVDPQIARTDFENFLSALQECGLIPVNGPGKAPYGG